MMCIFKGQYLSMSFLFVLVLLNCTPKTPIKPIQQTYALFEPLGSLVQVPLPTDLVKNTTTGRLQIPIHTDQDPPAQQHFNRYLNTLNGYPTSAIPEVLFSRPILSETVNRHTIKIFDITHKWPTEIKYVRFQVDTVQQKDHTGSIQEYGRIRMFNTQGWKRGRTYVIYILGGDKGMLDRTKAPIRRAPLFDLVIQSSPLCDWDPSASFDSQSGSCIHSSQGPATGCCRTNTSGDLAAWAGAFPRNGSSSSRVIEPLFAHKIRQAGSKLERIRQGYEQLLRFATVAGINPDRVVMLWNFSTAQGNEAIFDPSGTPPRIPLPSNLLRSAQTGLLQLPEPNKNAHPADIEFIRYLNTLNGYTRSSHTVRIQFQQAIDPSSASKGIALFSYKNKSFKQLQPSHIRYDSEKREIQAQIPKPLQHGSTYIAVAFSGVKGKGIRNPSGSSFLYPRRSAMMELALNPSPLCTCKGRVCDLSGKDRCDRILVSSFVDDLKDQPNARTALQKAERFEALRQRNNIWLEGILKKAAFKRDDILSIWGFTTLSMSEFEVDPGEGKLPFPNDLLRNTQTNKVQLPAVANETPVQKKLREGLNRLDGFSTLGSAYITYTGSLDPSSLQLGKTVLIIDLKTGALMHNWKIHVLETSSAILFTPQEPLNERQRYGIVLLSNVKPGSLHAASGIRDKEGKRIAASSFTALLRCPYSLYQNQKSTISLLDTQTAQRAEKARILYQPLFAHVDRLKVPRHHVVAAWMWTTQTLTEPLTQLRTFPWNQLKKTDRSNPQWNGSLVSPQGTFPSSIPREHIRSWAPNASFTSWLALDEQKTGTLFPDLTQGRTIQVPLAIVLPKTPMPPKGYPVAVFTHGLGRSKNDVVALANHVAQKGIALLSFDVLYHGSRTRCVQDRDCKSRCIRTTGKCATAFKDTNDDGVPDASGDYFLRLDHPFAVRDHLRQHVIDAAALLRGIALGAYSQIRNEQGKQASFRLDRDRVYLVGQSLGGILSTLVLATDSIPKRGVLNVPGGPLAEIIFTSKRFTETQKRLFAEHNVQEGTLAAKRLLSTLKWIMDPVDPLHFGHYLTHKTLFDHVNQKPVNTKQMLVQLAGKDQTIPFVLGQKLLERIGVPKLEQKRSIYPEQGHIFLLFPDPGGTLPATFAAQKQVAHFLATGSICTPNMQTGTCR